MPKGKYETTIPTKCPNGMSNCKYVYTLYNTFIYRNMLRIDILKPLFRYDINVFIFFLS